jgi:small subunit ribosomal protein S2
MEKSNMIEKLFAVGAHFGYAPSRRHPSVAPFIFGSKGGSEIFDLEKTVQCLDEALEVVKTLAAARKTILFVGSKAEARVPVKRVAERLNQPYVASRWIGGSLTNFSEIRKRLNRLADLTDMREKGELGHFTKRERLLIDREITDLDLMFGGLRGMSKLPDALIVVDPKRESIAVAEANNLNIPIIALLNTDCDRKVINHPIPMNDATQEAVAFVLDELATSYSAHLGAAPAPAATTNGSN